MAEGSDSAPVAATAAGPVRGAIVDGVRVFKGIRYGADTATTRFGPPGPPEPWTEVRDALGYGASAPQAPAADVPLFRSWRPDPPLPTSEDCLFLNVWTPGLRDGGRRPVMVWFHGGGFVSGSGSSNAYDGVRLAQRGDVVVVTVNHRLNLFGHLYLAEYGERFADSGNAGVLDLVLALRWVRDNIAEFGGDPENVTIFGESGGGGKVSVLMAMDAATGLFHRAVVQSGPWLRAVPAEDAAASAAKVLAELGLGVGDVDEVLRLPVEQILKASRAAPGAGSGPVLDGRNILRHPFDPDAPPQSEGVPLMIGTCRTETSLLVGGGRPALFSLSWEQLAQELAPTLAGRDAESIVASYRKLHPDRDAVDAYFTITTDRGFYATSVRQADRKAAQGGGPVYFYLLDWNTPVDGGKWRCPHALDIGFVFDNVAKSEAMSGIGPDQQRMADLMSESWLAFARTGNPNNALLPKWPTYDPSARATMIFDLVPRVLNDPRAADRTLFGRRPV
ncbi:MAG TPA: carboxylesterase/lipase family protein [Acidimicrobiales bacterium]|nr:carboxylesterase/lipase family protein [Acidimicrobiales bacterium]